MAKTGQDAQEAGGAKSGGQAEADLTVSIPAPVSPGKTSFVKFVGCVNTLWGSDRVLRSGQFLGRLIGGSPELGSEANALGLVFGAAFSQARYINRIYGILDGVQGLVYDVPDKPLHKGLKIVLHSVGAVGYHVLEHVALVLMIIRRCDPEKIPRLKGWLQKMGLWDKADDFDAFAQWCWLVEALIKLYFARITYRKIQAALKKAVATGDNAAVPKLLRRRLIVQCDMLKLVADSFLAPHYGMMIDGRPGFLSQRCVGVLGLAGSLGQLYVRYQQQTDREYSYDMGIRM